MFYDQLKKICEARGSSITTTMTKLNISKGTITNWRKGIIPNGEILKKIAEELEVTTDFLLERSEIESIDSPLIKLKTVLASTPQRVAALRNGNAVSQEELELIADCLNTNTLYLLSIDEKYTPLNKKKNSDFDINTLIMILSILDRVPDSVTFAVLQKKISHIINYNFERQGKTIDDLKGQPGMSDIKLDYLFNGNEKADKIYKYGYCFSELMTISSITKLSVKYLLTGEDK